MCHNKQVCDNILDLRYYFSSMMSLFWLICSHISIVLRRDANFE